ncbi:uncharacterized protein LOC135463108 [Liolophura sinensis]|uniref:uncharacterized protein LOC135463108 n=1 Tax=Liolophura sinensis TaxID=3198878 RepID=UPI003158D128
MSISGLFVSTVLCACALSGVKGHGRLMSPPSRASLWRDPRYKTLASALQIQDYNDMGMNCGGFWRQWGLNGGKCGICGDPWDVPDKPHEFPNGKYAKGIIVDKFKSGDIMPVKVQLTANHRGWFEFRLCPHNDNTSEATQECLDQHVLKIAGGSSTRTTVYSNIYNYNIQLQLPNDLTCERCVFQWKYQTGNSWGVDPITKNGCLGCGIKHEQFYACSDIAIEASETSGGDDGGDNNGGEGNHGGAGGDGSDNGGNDEEGGDNGGNGGNGGEVTKPPCKGAGKLANIPEVAVQCKITCASGCCPRELCDDACRNL